jgi:hypothetical protein
MPHTCIYCDQTSNRFNAGQYREGGQCKDCEKNEPRCVICARVFIGPNWSTSLNQLKMHQQTHLPQTVSCPVCQSSKRFKSAAGAVLHLESGRCEGCRGQENARQQIYSYVKRKASHLVTNQLMIEDGYHSNEDISYQCCHCSKTFPKLSSLMQHESASHPGGGTSRLQIGN